MKFPSNINSNLIKLKQIAEDPLCFHLHKNGDLLDKIQKEPVDWHDRVSRKDLYALLAEEKALLIEKKLKFLKSS